jgi:hypothetical protein
MAKKKKREKLYTCGLNKQISHRRSSAGLLASEFAFNALCAVVGKGKEGREKERTIKRERAISASSL